VSRISFLAKAVALGRLRPVRHTHVRYLGIGLITLFATCYFYLHPHLWPFLSRRTDSSLAISLYSVGGMLVLLGCVVSVNPPKTVPWKAAGVAAFLILFYAGFVVTKEQATRTTLAAIDAKNASSLDASNKQKYDEDVRLLNARITGMTDAIVALSKGSKDPKWGELLNHLDRKSAPRFSLDLLSVTTSFPPTPGTTSVALAKFHVIATNVGETPAHGWEIQIAMKDVTGGRYVMEPMVAGGKIPDDIEVNHSQIFTSNNPVIIPAGCGPQIIRVWMRYADLLHPKQQPITQTIWRRWGGWNNPNSVNEISGHDLQPIERMFYDLPTPQ
jgi:hypothetical protein